MNTFKIKGGSTWNDIMKDKKITDIQDPIMEMEIPKSEFENMYKEIVCELQGNDECYESYANYYFTNNPMKLFVLSFRGEKEKDEFYNIGLKNNSVLSLTEIQEGEETIEKNKRKEKETIEIIEPSLRPSTETTETTERKKRKEEKAIEKNKRKEKAIEKKRKEQDE